MKCEKKLCVAGQGDREGYASTIIVLGLSRRLEIFYSCHGKLKLLFFLCCELQAEIVQYVYA